jgi:HAD superfamily hydrolase (TIGR01509 family)
VIGAAMPDQGIYTTALQALALPAEQVLFVHDSPHHLAGAAAAGIRSHHFQGDNFGLGDVLRQARVLHE